MDRTQILIEQEPFRGASQTAGYRQELVWLPLGTAPGRWLHWILKSHSDSVDGATVRNIDSAWACNVRAGAYYARGDAAWSVVSGTWPDYTALYGWRAVTNSPTAVGAAMRLTLGVDAERVYLLALQNSNGSLCDVTITGGGTVVAPVLNFDDAEQAGVAPSWPNALNMGYADAVLVARNMQAGDTLTITVATASTVTRIVGAIAVGSAAANPDTGVVDPASLIRCQVLGQYAPAPYYLDIAGANARWWGSGNHWDASNTLLNEAETWSYTDANGAVQAWAPAADSRVTAIALGLSYSFAGDVQTVVGAGVDTVGTYREQCEFGPSGLLIRTRLTVSANGEAVDVRLSTSNYGGYKGQWTPWSGPVLVRSAPGNWTLIGPPWDSSYPVATPATVIEAHNPAAALTARLLIGGDNPGQILRVNKRAEGFAKLYADRSSYAVDLAAGQTLDGWQLRQIVDGSEVLSARR
jgi:hypothetical protein